MPDPNGEQGRPRVSRSPVPSASREGWWANRRTTAEPPERCPTCESDDPSYRKRVGIGGEVSIEGVPCTDPFHTPPESEQRCTCDWDRMIPDPNCPVPGHGGESEQEDPGR